MTQLTLSAEAYDRINSLSWERDTFRGNAIIDDSFRILVNTLEQEGLLQDLEWKTTSITANQFANVSNGEQISLAVSPPRSASYFFGQSLKDMLERYPRARLTEPPDYYLADVKFRAGSVAPKLVTDYKNVLIFIKLLQELADYSNDQGDQITLIFVNKGKVEIPVFYASEDIRSLENIQKLFADLHEEPHLDHKKTIFTTAMCDLIRQRDPVERFRFLINQFEVLNNTYVDNYKLFVSGFSFEKMREDIENRKLDFVIRVNKVFTDIQDKLLAIPLAAILAVTSTKEINAPIDYITNIVVLLAVILFGSFMALLIRNQSHTLQSIKDEYSSKQRSYQNQAPSVFKDFEESFRQLDRRHDQQQLILRRVTWAVGLVCIMTLLLFVIRLPPVASWIAGNSGASIQSSTSVTQ